MTKFGSEKLNNNFSNNSSNLSTKIGQIKDDVSNVIILGEVIDIILDEMHPKFKDLGGWSSIGTVEYKNIATNRSTTSDPGSSGLYAKPLFINSKYYPLRHEIITIISAPSQTSENKGNGYISYYLCAINIWNSPHNNALPPLAFNNNDNKSYNVASLGSTNKSKNTSNNIDLGPGFIERSNIHPLIPYLGDYILEGRWSNSIRLGSTYKSSTLRTSNQWSEYGENGNPITIISNGQPSDSSSDGSEPITEDINKDLSSIYLTSNQKIPINPTQFLTKSYTTYVPDKLNQYVGSQAILNANRILINSNKDHILLNSSLTIGFNSAKGFNFDTPTNFVVAAPVIKLGDKDTTNPMLRGNETVAALNTVCDQLIKISTALSTLAELIPTAPQAVVNIAASEAMAALTQLKGEINVPGNLKSKTNFLI